jgi:pimeloyl-ACP methyl ester carboxylesterase
MRDDEMLACWRAIKAPVLWIEGAESGAIAAMRQRSGIYEERMGALQTLAGLERVENAGHNVHHDQPEKLAALIEGFMSGR